jgi:GT2 family glycosyltransferase
MKTISILALCYNHAEFLNDALQSLNQLPKHVQILILDDASTDQSPEILKNWQNIRLDWTFIFHAENKGNCKSFNELLKLASGDWILDFATDDVVNPEMLMSMVEKAAACPDAGFCYADARIFRQKHGPFLHFSKLNRREASPEGRILPKFFPPGFICPPAVLFSRKALQIVGGYNESLSYEDLDVWLRLARKFPVYWFPETIVNYRKHDSSMSAGIFRQRSGAHLQSTREILSMILEWQEFQPPDPGLVRFIRYHVKLSFFLQLPEICEAFYRILKEQGQTKNLDEIFRFWAGKLPGITELYLIFVDARNKLRYLFYSR